MGLVVVGLWTSTTEPLAEAAEVAALVLQVFRWLPQAMVLPVVVVVGRMPLVLALL
jgi:hypothetical protein